jgi:hypothetical protein
MLIRRATFHLALALAAGSTLAQQPGGPAALRPAPVAVAPPFPAECATVAASVSELPEDVDLVVVVEHCNELRGSPWGAAVAKLLTDSGQMGELTKKWDGLADQLGWDRSETFDRLLGQRVILVSNSAGEGHDRRWALMSDVDAETEKRLKERLQAAPRAIVEGHQILSLENGEYELASHHAISMRAGAGGGAGVQPEKPSDRVTLILGPRGKGELFDELLGSLTRAATRPAQPANIATPGTLGSREVFKQACEAGGLASAEVLVLAALDSPDNKQPWSDFVMLAGQRVRPDANAPANAGAAWHSRVLVRQQARRENLLRTEPTSDSAFRTLSKDSIVAIVQNVSLPDVLGQWAMNLGTIGQMIPMPDEAKQAMTPRQALVCRAVEPDARVSCTFAMGSSDTGALARKLDGPIAAWLSRVEKQLGFDSAPVCDYAGLAPSAVRVSPVGGAGVGGAADGPVPLLSSKPLTVSWAFPSRPDAPCDHAPGWWAVNVSQRVPHGAPKKECGASPSDILRGDADALIGEAPGSETARWVCLATARPRTLETMLPAAVPDIQGFRSALRRLERIDLRLRITDVGDIQGDLDIQLPAGE